MIQKKGQGCPAGVAVSETPNLTARANGLPLGEPRAPEDQATAEKRLRYRHNGASDTIRKIEDHTAIGAFGSGALETYKTDGNRRDENPVGVRDTYSNDQSGTAVGALNMIFMAQMALNMAFSTVPLARVTPIVRVNQASPLARLTPIMAVLTLLLARVTPIGMAQMTFITVRLAQ